MGRIGEGFLVAAALSLAFLSQPAAAQSAAQRCSTLSGDAAIAACDEAIKLNPKGAVFSLFASRLAESRQLPFRVSFERELLSSEQPEREAGGDQERVMPDRLLRERSLPPEELKQG